MYFKMDSLKSAVQVYKAFHGTWFRSELLLCYCNQASGDYRLMHVQYVHCTCTCIVYLIVYVIVNDTREYYL